MNGLPKFILKVNVIQVGNGESVNTLFIIPIIMTIQGHMFEIYMMVSDIHDNVDSVFGVKNFEEVEGESRRELSFKFLNRVVPIFPVCKEMIKPKERRYVKVEALFLDETTGLGIIKLLAMILWPWK